MDYIKLLMGERTGKAKPEKERWKLYIKKRLDADYVQHQGFVTVFALTEGDVV